MFSKFTLVAAACVAAALVGSSSAFAEGAGTTTAYAECYRAIKLQGLEDQAAMKFCTYRTQISIDRGLVAQGEVSRNGDLAGINVTVWNISPDMVVTSFDVSVTAPNG